MKNHSKKLYIVSGIIFLGVIALIFSGARTNHVIEPVQQPIVEIAVKKELSTTKITAAAVQTLSTASIITGGITTQISFAPNAIFYDILMQEKAAGRLDFSGKQYPGLGFFVTDIGPLHHGDGKDLLYYVNGKEATVGVSAYTPKDGDIIEWKLK